MRVYQTSRRNRQVNRNIIVQNKLCCTSAWVNWSHGAQLLRFKLFNSDHAYYLCNWPVEDPCDKTRTNWRILDDQFSFLPTSPWMKIPLKIANHVYFWFPTKSQNCTKPLFSVQGCRGGYSYFFSSHRKTSPLVRTSGLMAACLIFQKWRAVFSALATAHALRVRWLQIGLYLNPFFEGRWSFFCFPESARHLPSFLLFK